MRDDGEIHSSRAGTLPTCAIHGSRSARFWLCHDAPAGLGRPGQERSCSLPPMAGGSLGFKSRGTRYLTLDGRTALPLPHADLCRHSAPESMPRFARYVGIDYSGAETPESSLKGLRVFSATPEMGPTEVLPPPGPRKYWTRRGISEWLIDQLRDGPPTLVGIDHAFSFPIRYFEVHRIPPDWPTFLDDFQKHWPTDQPIYVNFVRDGLVGNGAARQGHTRWRRLCEQRSRTAKSVFHFDVQGSVAKSTHAGIPWLLHIRRTLKNRIFFWPFDCWEPPADASVVAEVYPALWNRGYPRENRDVHQHDAWSVARWFREADSRDELPTHFNPALTGSERKLARVEGWILGLK